ncbi:MAG TPA: hypothetical protein PLJ99_04675 [Kiritimatiellia bacterium]|nr:hypothetical protein [Kiritimatiellia bacterium]
MNRPPMSPRRFFVSSLAAGAICLLALPLGAGAGVMDAIGDGFNYVAGGIKQKVNDAGTYITDSAAGKFVNPAERNKRDRERILSVLSYQGAIYYDEKGKPRVKDQRKLDQYYRSLQDNKALNKVYGFSPKDDPRGEKSGQFWRNFLDGKDHTRGDTPAVMDPFENNSRGLATKMHSQLTTATDEASSDYNITAGELKVRGIDILEQDLRQGVAAGADTYIKALDALTGGTSTKAVEWMEEAAKQAKAISDDPSGAARDFVQGQIEDRLKDKIGEYKSEMLGQADEALKKALGQDRYDELMDKYEKYGEGQERLQKIFEDLARVTGDKRLEDAARKIGEFSPDAIAGDLSKKVLPKILQEDEDGDEEAAKEADDKVTGPADPESNTDSEPEEKDGQETEPEAESEPVEPDGESPDTSLEPGGDEPETGDVPEPQAETEDEETEESEDNDDSESAEEKETADSAEEDRTGSSSGGEETAADEPEVTDDEAENEPEDIPESDDTSMPDETDDPAPDTSSGESTITKGYVEGEDGSRITLTETRDADGNIVSATETETDADGNVISQTTYEGGTGEGRTTPDSPDLRDAEPPSDADVDVDLAANGYKTADDFSSQWTGNQEQRGADSSLTMAQNAQMEESSNIGNQQIRDAKTTKDAGGRDARNIRDDSTRNVNKADRENSWGKAIGDAVESGITEGGKAFGQALGQGAADEVVGEIFGSDEDDSDAAGESGAGETRTAASPSSGSSSSGSSGQKKPPASSASSGGSKPTGTASSSSSSSGAGTASADLPTPDPTDPIGVSSSTRNDDGTITITYGCSYTWTGKPPGPSRCPICDRETVSTATNTPPTTTSTSATPATSTTPPASSTPPRDWWLVCARCKHYPCGKQPPGPGDDVLYWIVCPKCGWKIGMSNSGQ